MCRARFGSMICLLNKGKGGKEDRRGKKKAIIWFGNAKKNGVTEAQSELFYIIVERGLIVE